MFFHLEDDTRQVTVVMRTELYLLTADTMVASARRLIAESGVRHLIVNHHGALQGVVSRRDLADAKHDGLIGESMASPVICVNAGATVMEAVAIMEANDIGFLPVIHGQHKLVGTVNRQDLDPQDQDLETETDCAACGSQDRVFCEFRAGCIPLCAGCRKGVPSILDSAD